MYKVGLTGGIGSGKSFVAAVFELLGIPVYYADARAKDLMYRNKELKSSVKQLLGEKAYHKNGRPNRGYIASKIFNDRKLLKQMNALVHPTVRQDFEIWANNQDALYVLEESALLFEIKGQKYFEDVILVVADEEIRINRVLKRDKTNKKAVLSRIKQQLKDDKKIPLADFIVDNNGNKSILQQVLKIHKEILKKI